MKTSLILLLVKTKPTLLLLFYVCIYVYINWNGMENSGMYFLFGLYIFAYLFIWGVKDESRGGAVRVYVEKVAVSYRVVYGVAVLWGRM